MFEKCLVENMRDALAKIENLKISRVRGRIWIELKNGNDFTQDELDIIKKQLPKVFGMESFSPGVLCKPDLEEIRSAVRKSVDNIFKPAMEKSKGPLSFRIRARRSDKKFPLRSKEIEIKLAELVAEIYGEENLNVDLMNAAVSVCCEVREEFAFVFYEVCAAPGGLPVGCNDSVLVLLSGGIDSPVASYMTMKRGSPVNFITFHSSPYTPPETVDKVRGIVKVINEYQRGGALFICNLAPIQKMIRDKCSERYRTILYRRMMFRIAEKVAFKNKMSALATGEAVGQVASQTISNLNTINDAVRMLILRPLIGMDKHEAIVLSRKMGTYDLSNEQVPDSCTVFAPNSPATASKIPLIEKEEEKLGDYNSILEEIISSIEFERQGNR